MKGFALQALHLGALSSGDDDPQSRAGHLCEQRGMSDSEVLRALRERGRRGDRRLADFRVGRHPTQPRMRHR